MSVSRFLLDDPAQVPGGRVGREVETGQVGLGVVFRPGERGLTEEPVAEPGHEARVRKDVIVEQPIVGLARERVIKVGNLRGHRGAEARVDGRLELRERERGGGERPERHVDEDNPHRLSRLAGAGVASARS
jgi:hypothetical protein